MTVMSPTVFDLDQPLQSRELGHAPTLLVAFQRGANVAADVLKAVMKHLDERAAENRAQPDGDVGWFFPAAVGNPVIFKREFALGNERDDGATVCHTRSVPIHRHDNASAHARLIGIQELSL